MTTPLELNICHLYPDLLNLYGDRGNIAVLRRRAEWRGIRVNIAQITMGEAYRPGDHDITFLGGGQDYEQQIIQRDFVNDKGPAVKEAIEADKVMLCICGGYQLLGKYYKTWDGVEIEFLGALNLWTIGGKKRMIGNIVFECDFLRKNAGDSAHDGRVVGFENHSGRTFLGEGVRPLGKVLHGSGNNGKDGGEGAIYRNVFCSYSHGSILPKNPDLADHLIATALARKYNGFDPESLAVLDDRLEHAAHSSMVGRFV